MMDTAANRRIIAVSGSEMNNAASVEFWQRIVALSEMTISSLKVAQVMAGEDQTSHLAGLSRLQALLSEQA